MSYFHIVATETIGRGYFILFNFIAILIWIYENESETLTELHKIPHKCRYLVLFVFLYFVRNCGILIFVLNYFIKNIIPEKNIKIYQIRQKEKIE